MRIDDENSNDSMLSKSIDTEFVTDIYELELIS